MSGSAQENRFENVIWRQHPKGVLELKMHSGSGPFVLTARSRDELVDVFARVATDPDVRVLVFTGTGNSWLTEMDASGFGSDESARDWDRNISQGRRLVRGLLDIDVPVIAAVNGPAHIHSELILTCDIVLAAPTVSFQDSHVHSRISPGDGMHVLWPYTVGSIRGRGFLLTGQVIDARTALEWGVVSEIVPADQLLPRALQIAFDIAGRPPLTVRYTRMMLTQRLKRLIDEGLGFGLALEGLSLIAKAQEDRE